MATWHDRIQLWRKFADHQQDSLHLLDAHTGFNKPSITLTPKEPCDLQLHYTGWDGGMWAQAAVTYWLSGTFGRSHNRWSLQPTGDSLLVGFKNSADRIYMMTAWHGQSVCDLTTPAQRVLIMLGAVRLRDHHALKYHVSQLNEFELELQRQLRKYVIPH